MVGCLCAWCATLHGLSTGYWDIDTGIGKGDVGVDIEMVSSRTSGMARLE